MVAGSLQHLRHRDDLQLIVLTGRAHLDIVASAATDVAPLLVRPIAFLDRIELALAVADLAVARAGAGHIAELTDCGVPSILVPYPHATENHQEANARELVSVRAPPSSRWTPSCRRNRSRAASWLWWMTGERRNAMAAAALAWATPDADRAARRPRARGGGDDPLRPASRGSIPTLGVPSLEQVRAVHLIGVGGAGMRNLARLFLAEASRSRVRT